MEYRPQEYQGFNVIVTHDAKYISLLSTHRRRMWEEIGWFTKKELRTHERNYRRWLRPRLKSGRVTAFIALRANRVAASGCLWLREEQPRPGSVHSLVPYLMSMYTEEDMRMRGAASKIVTEALMRAGRRGFDRVVLHTSHFGLRVYQRLGFVQSNEMVCTLPDTGSR
jgi:GNAT superfamily N-acetyltransferase